MIKMKFVLQCVGTATWLVRAVYVPSAAKGLSVANVVGIFQAACSPPIRAFATHACGRCKMDLVGRLWKELWQNTM